MFHWTLIPLHARLFHQLHNDAFYVKCFNIRSVCELEMRQNMGGENIKEYKYWQHRCGLKMAMNKSPYHHCVIHLFKSVFLELLCFDLRHGFAQIAVRIKLKHMENLSISTKREKKLYKSRQCVLFFSCLD